MSLLVSVTLDAGTEGGTGQGLVSWFGTALSWPLGELLEREREGAVESLATTLMCEGAERREFALARGEWDAIRAELARGPETADVLVFYSGAERPTVHVHSSSILVKRPNAEVQLFFLGDEAARAADAAFCAALVSFLVSALNPVNPAFGRVCAGEPITERANLDSVLGRKVRRSVAQARQWLRGYAWVTVCPAELTAALGGANALERSGAFHRVVPLASGGTLLQATETLAGFSDDAMRRTFETLAPVLPAGVPQVDPAHPQVRFVPQDAARFAGGGRC
ncbi:hypothetical protein [Streptomyces sp. NPDC002265]|uniref:hypothetical protein n=1 Tax=Streptomyces sp. NPDC002265 TaxID=3154415 RepID=UPI0033203FB7